MKIDKIKKTKSGKYNLVLDNNEKITTYDDVILKNNLLYNKEINSDELLKIMNDTNYYDVYNKTIKYISLKMRSFKEIKIYLSKFNLEEKVLKEIIINLERIGLINDQLFVKSFIHDRMYLSNDGPLKIKEELYNHDIDENIILIEISKIEDSFIKDKVSKLIDKKIKHNHKKADYVLRQKIMFELINLGYEKDLISELLDNIDINDDDILNKEYEKIYKNLSKKYSGILLNKKIKEKLYQKGFDINAINNFINEKNSTY
jgi:regulatory protein